MSFDGISEELGVVAMTCNVNYSGNWAPVMKWQQDGGSVITTGVVDDTVPYKSVASSLTVSVTMNVTGSKFSCTTYFAEGNRPTTTRATNVPDYSYTWTSHSFNRPIGMQQCAVEINSF